MVCFLVIFVIIIIKIFSGHTRKTWFLTSKKEDQVARIRGMGGGVEVIRAMPERKRSFAIDVFPYRHPDPDIPGSVQKYY